MHLALSAFAPLNNPMKCHWMPNRVANQYRMHRPVPQTPWVGMVTRQRARARTISEKDPKVYRRQMRASQSWYGDLVPNGTRNIFAFARVVICQIGICSLSELWRLGDGRVRSPCRCVKWRHWNNSAENSWACAWERHWRKWEYIQSLSNRCTPESMKIVL